MALKIDKTRSSIYIWTFKAGLMARLAHDLQIEACDYQFSIQGSLDSNWSAELVIPVSSFRVLGAVRKKVLQAGKLSLDERVEIEQTLQAKVLNAQQFPVIRYSAVLEGRESQKNFRGELTIKDQTNILQVEGRMERTITGVHLKGEAIIHQSDFGIKPFQAFLGALKIKDEVEVSWDIYLSESGEDSQGSIPAPL
jgi:polyisoprenoid-binding protein YceI